jgi:hypothetical protein
MKALRFNSFGNLSELRLEEVPTPSRGARLDVSRIVKCSSDAASFLQASPTFCFAKTDEDRFNEHHTKNSSVRRESSQRLL